MDEYELLVQNENIGIYNGCEVTEIFIINKKTNNICNLYTLIVYEEFPRNIDLKFITDDNKIEINNDLYIGIMRYYLSLDEVKENYNTLKDNKKWISNHENDSELIYPQLKKLKKQFIPYLYNSRLNKILKNNFFNGSYILEFFDEKKEFEFLLNNDVNFENICEEIEKLVPLDLYLVRDRLGNFIFQFPVNIVEISGSYDFNTNYITHEFAWHEKILEKQTPPCIIEIESKIENTCHDFVIEQYRQTKQKTRLNGNFPPTNVKIFREDLNLLLYYNNNHILSEFELETQTVTGKERKFIDKSKPKSVKLYTTQYYSNPKNYAHFIETSQHIFHQWELEETLSFKMYPNDKENPLEDIITLIKKYGMRGTWLWDPYLRKDEIISTLFYSPWHNVPLKSLTVINKKTSRFSKKSFLTCLKKCLNHSEIESKDNKSKVKKQFNNLSDNYEGLNIEFKSQKEGNLHDRFIIFPGDSKHFINPKVFSLGTSINSYGKQKHILQEVLYPQRIVDEFEKEWKKGECIWKYP